MTKLIQAKPSTAREIKKKTPSAGKYSDTYANGSVAPIARRNSNSIGEK